MKKSLVLVVLFIVFMNTAYMQSPGGYDKDGLPYCQAMFQYYYNDCTILTTEAYPVQFNDLSTGDVVQWTWDFGDGTASTDMNPLHFFKYNGDTVTVCLTIVTSDDCISNYCSTFVFNPPWTPPECNAYFYMYQDSFVNCICYRFQGFSNGETTSWHWDFGDGTESYEQAPLHAFPADGWYNVCLTTTRSDGQSCSYCQEVYSGGDPIPTDCNISFEFLTLESYPPQYHFVPSPADSIGWYYWDFGDGNQTYEESPTHTYKYSGFYTVCLTTKTLSGCKANYCLSLYAEGESKDCQAYWEEYPIDWWLISSVRPPDSLPYPASTSFVFYDQSRGMPVSWHWTFGDGTESFDQNPYHTYAETGVYTVCLEIITADSCTSQYCDSVFVGMQEPCSLFGTVVDYTGLDGCGLVIQLDNGLMLEPQEIVPEFTLKDGQRVRLSYTELTGSASICMVGMIVRIDCIEEVYPQPGLCDYRLSIQTNMIVGPVYSCEGSASVKLLDALGNESDAQSYQWSTGSEENYVNNLCTNTEYQVTAIDPDGCFLTGSFIFYGGGSISYDTLWGNWEYEKDGMDFIFNIPVYKEGYNCVWNFGDGNTSQGSNVTHTYAEDGEYVVVLNLYDTEGNPIYTREITVNTGAPTGIPDQTESHINFVYPVPAKDQLHISLFSSVSQQAIVEVYNSSGQQILVKEIQTPAGSVTVALDIADLPAGAYYGMLLSGTNGNNPFKFIK